MTNAELARELAAEGYDRGTIERVLGMTRQAVKAALAARSSTRGRPRNPRCKSCGQALPQPTTSTASGGT